MGFWEQALATFLGFVGALALFWVKAHIESSRKEKFLAKNLHYELDYNAHTLTKICERLEATLNSALEDRKDIYLNIDYAPVARHFARCFYNEGLISKYLNVDDVKKWNDFLIELSEGAETYASETVENWRKGEATKEHVSEVLGHEIAQVKYAIELCNYFKRKVPLK